MESNWQPVIKLLGKYNALSLRERGVIAVLVFVLIFIIWNEFIWSSQGVKQQDFKQKVASTKIQIDALELQINTFKANQVRDPDAKEKQQLDQLLVLEARLDEQLQKTMHGLIKPAQMAKVLEAVLTRQTDLKLYRIANLPTQDVLAVNKIQEGTKQSLQSPKGGVYKHGLQIEFRGSYLSALAYLKALDELPWDFYWDELALNVQEYPESHITITVHTLSLEEGFIGV